MRAVAWKAHTTAKDAAIDGEDDDAAAAHSAPTLGFDDDEPPRAASEEAADEAPDAEPADEWRWQQIAIVAGIGVLLVLAVYVFFFRGRRVHVAPAAIKEARTQRRLGRRRILP